MEKKIMNQIKDKVPEALSILENTKENLELRKEKSPTWFPIEELNSWNKTDLTFEYCLKLFAQLEAIKREKFPPETMRQWFIEFIRRGWTKFMLMERYKGLLNTKIYGIEKLDIADWINAVEVYAQDEVNLMVERRVNALIQRGNYLKNKKIELSEEDKKAVDLAVANEIELKYKSGYYD